jgi:hypothetical protein
MVFSSELEPLGAIFCSRFIPRFHHPLSSPLFLIALFQFWVFSVSFISICLSLAWKILFLSSELEPLVVANMKWLN